MRLDDPDILECLRARMGCEYISQLRASPYGKDAVKELAHFELKGYPVSAWAQAISYLTNEDVSFQTYDEVARLIARCQEDGRL